MKFILTLLIALSSATFASTLSWKDKSFNIQIPAGWETVNDMFGIPVTLLGPFNKKINARPIVQVTPTDQKPMPMNEKDVKTFDKNYSAGRVKWINENHGKLSKLIPAKLETKNRLMAGVEYSMSGKGYVVRTFYVNCPKNLYNLKIFLHAGLADYLPIAEEAVRSFSCAE